MPSLLETFASYVPAAIARQLARQGDSPAGLALDRFPAAVLFADISGFTALAERLAHKGAQGTEDLTRLLNGYFGNLIELVHGHGGDILKFAGDALLAVWPVADDGPDLASQVQAAARCALEIQATIRNRRTREDIPLALRVGVSAGEVSLAQLGGVEDRWEVYAAGLPVSEVGRAESLAEPGQVVLSPYAWSLLADAGAGQALPTGYMCLESLSRTAPLQATVMPELTPDAEAALSRFVPGAVRTRLEAGQEAWVAELRQVSVLFVHLPDLQDSTSLDQAQSIVHSLQTLVHRYEGSINKLSVDDKGASLLVAFGLPPLAHEDDPVRAVQVAMAMRESLSGMGLRSGIGVTTGRVFCGEIGSATRREYTLIGDVVNLSARLMTAAGEGILCDQNTHQASSGRIAFDAPSTIQVKGKAEPVAVFQPKGQAQHDAHTEAMVGRLSERQFIEERLQAIASGASGAIVVIEAEAGLGKSRLLSHTMQQADRMGVRGFLGLGDAIEKSSPYYAWRPIFRQLFQLEAAGDDPEARRRHVLAQLESDAEAHQLAPLLNVVLPLDLPDNDLTTQFSGIVRADNTRNLLVRLLRQRFAEAPTLLILEDAHWLDSASWSLALQVCRRLPGILAVLAIRPLGQAAPSEYRQILELPESRILPLGPLPAEGIVALVCQRLGVASLPDDLVAFILQKAEGHPYFTEEVAYALRDSGAIQIVDGSCRLAPGSSDLQSLELPNTIEGVITSRIDRLSPAQQLILKVGSAIGRVFAYRTLRDVYPIEGDKPLIADELELLDRLDLTLLETPEPDLSYLFKHIITQEVVYNLMLYAQRKQLHEAVALWFEKTYADGLSPHYALLAYHWQKAEDYSRAVDYLDRAGAQAVQSGAYQEATRFLEEALLLEEKASVKSDRLRLARRERLLAEAQHGLGHLDSCREHLERAVSLLGWPLPETDLALIPKILEQVLVQLLNRLWPSRTGKASPEERESLLEAVRAYERLGVINYYACSLLPGLFTCFQMLNLAEKAGPSPELANANANMCVGMAVIPWPSQAEVYGRRCVETARIVGKPSAMAWAKHAHSIAQAGFGRWEESLEALDEASETHLRIGDLRRYIEGIQIRVNLQLIRGEFRTAAETGRELAERGHSLGDFQHKGWGMIAEALAMLQMGRKDEASTLVEAALPLTTGSAGRILDEMLAYSTLAMVRLRQGQLHLARRAAETALLLFEQGPPTAFYLMDAYSNVAEVFVTLQELRTRAMPAERSDLARCARRACRRLHAFAKVFPPGRARASLWEGRRAWLLGKESAAFKAWEKSLRESEAFGLPFDDAQVRLEIARRLDPADSRRAAHLALALEKFEQAGATHHVQQVLALQER